MVNSERNNVIPAKQEHLTIPKVAIIGSPIEKAFAVYIRKNPDMPQSVIVISNEKKEREKMGKMSNILSMLKLMMGGDKFNGLAMADVSTPHSSTFHSYSRPNQRRQRNRMRRSVFANRRIARGF